MANREERALHKACEQGSLGEAKAALQCGEETHRVDKFGCLPIHYACEHIHEDAAMQLVEAVSEGCDVSTAACMMLNRASSGPHWKCAYYCRKEKRPCGQTPLHVACKAGNLAVIRFLLKDKRISPLSKNCFGQNPLHVACISGSVDTVKAIIEACGLFSRMICDRDSEGCLPLHYASMHDCTRLVQLVSTQTGVVTVACISRPWYSNKSGHSTCLTGNNVSGQTPLHIACKTGHVHIVKTLLEYIPFEQAFRVCNCFKQTLLHVACTEKKDTVVNLLVSKAMTSHLSWMCNVRDTAQCIPLHYACQNNSLEIVQTIADATAVYAISHNECGYYQPESWAEKQGLSLLHIACKNNTMKNTILADNLFNRLKQTLLHVACIGANVEVVKGLMEEYDGDKMSHIRDVYQCLPLHYACQHASLELVKLVSKGCKVTDISCLAPNNRHNIHRLCATQGRACGQTPLHLASISGKSDVVKYLLEECLDDIPYDEICNCFKQTILHVACLHGHVQIVKYLLLKCGFGMCSAKDQYGHLPEYYAQRHDSLKLVDLASISRCVNERNDFRAWPHISEQLHLACKSGIPELVKYLIKNRDFDHKKLINAFHFWPNRPEQLREACKSGVPKLVWYIYENRGPLSPSNDEDDLAFKLWPRGDYQLHEACKSGVLGLVKHLLSQRKCPIDVQDSEGKVAFDYLPRTTDLLQRACTNGIPELVHHLICHEKCTSSKEEAFKTWPAGEKQFHLACKSGVLELVKYLVEKRDCAQYINKATDFEGTTPLHMACCKVCSQKKCNTKYTAVIRFLTIGMHVKCAKHRRDLNKALHMPCCKRNDANKKLLGDHDKNLCIHNIPCKCDMHMKNENGELPLHIACQNLTLADVKILSDFDKASEYNVNTTAHNRERPIDIALRRIEGDIAQESSDNQHTPETFQMIYYLVDIKKCNISSTNNENILLKAVMLRQEKYSKKSDTEYLRLAKLVITGGPEVGKSSFRKRLFQTLKQCYEEETDGDGFINIKELTHMYAIPSLDGLPWEEVSIGKQCASFLEGKLIVHILDTGGQPRIHKLLPALVTGPAIYLVFFKLNDKLRRPSVQGFRRKDQTLTVTNDKPRRPSVQGSHRKDQTLTVTNDKPRRRPSARCKDQKQTVTSFSPADIIFQTISTISCFTQPHALTSAPSLHHMHSDDSGIGMDCLPSNQSFLSHQDSSFNMFHWLERNSSESVNGDIDDGPIVFNPQCSCRDSTRDLLQLESTDNGSSSSSTGTQPVCILVGTHKDKVKQEMAEEVISELQKMLEKIQAKDLIAKYQNKTVAAISKTDPESEMNTFRSFLKEKVDQKCQNICPEWLLFQGCIAELGQDVVPLKKCRKIAEECCEIVGEDFEDALTYLHYHVGSLLWYRQVETYKDLVIVNIQSLYTHITDFMDKTFTEDDVYYEEFTTKGLFTPAALNEKSKKVQGYYNFSNLIHLLIYLRIVACITPKDDAHNPKKHIYYFMPSVLRSIDVDKLHHSDSTSPSPLLVQFDCGFCPVGMFSFLVVELLNCTKHEWTLDPSQTQYSNMVVMTVGVACDTVRLIERNTFFEIWLEPDSEARDLPPALNNIRCFEVKQCIHESLKAVTRMLNYSRITGHKFAFFCHQHEDIQQRNIKIAVEQEMNSGKVKCPACKPRLIKYTDPYKCWYGVGDLSATLIRDTNIKPLGKY